MSTNDTLQLLQVCDAGAKMALDSIKQVLPKTKSPKLTGVLERYRVEHRHMEQNFGDMLHEHGTIEADPSVMAQMMASMSTGVKLAFDESDAKIADIVSNGCSMGIKTVTQSINRCPAASEDSVGAAKQLIRLEESFAEELRPYL